MNEKTMSVLTNIQSKLTAKRQKVDTQLALLLAEPTDNNLETYRLMVSEFITSAVTQIYLSGLKAHWHNLASVNLYDEISAMDGILADITKCVSSKDTTNLANNCQAVNNVLDKFTMININ